MSDHHYGEELFSWNLLGFYHGLLLMPFTSHLYHYAPREKFGFIHLLYTLPLGSCRQLMTKRLYKVNYI